MSDKIFYTLYIDPSLKREERNRLSLLTRAAVKAAGGYDYRTRQAAEAAQLKIKRETGIELCIGEAFSLGIGPF